jgi:hypothetical protein
MSRFFIIKCIHEFVNSIIINWDLIYDSAVRLVRHERSEDSCFTEVKSASRTYPPDFTLLISMVFLLFEL